MAMCGWFVDVSAWEPATPQWNQALELLPEHERQQVQRFVFAKDQRLALASRLLRRQLVHSVFRVPLKEICISRTPEGKPYWQRIHTPPADEYWNFNVSHHGTIVAIAAHSQALVGVDAVQLSERPRRRQQDAPPEDFFRAFADHFTPSEWRYIRRSDHDDARFYAFYRLWSLKESYIKAVGIGLGFKLLRAEFFSEDATEEDWRMRLDGELAAQWRFKSIPVHGSVSQDVHLISIALGPIADMWEPSTSSMFPTQRLPTATHQAFEIPGLFQWQEKNLDELVSEL